MNKNQERKELGQSSECVCVNLHQSLTLMGVETCLLMLFSQCQVSCLACDCEEGRKVEVGSLGIAWASLVAQMVKSLPAVQETRVRLQYEKLHQLLDEDLRPGILQARTLEWVAISFSNA